MSKTVKPVVAVIDGGMSYHDDSINREPFKGYFDEVIYLRDVPVVDLSRFDILIIPCRTNAYWLAPLSDQLQDFMRGGGTLVAMGETFPEKWLPDIGFRAVETNFWWWLEEGADLGVKISNPDHSMSHYVSREAATFHLHGVFTPLNSNQRMLIETKEGECLLFEDMTTYAPGRLIATTLDPFFHHGWFFMPATTEFLKGFLPWLIESTPPAAGERKAA